MNYDEFISEATKAKIRLKVSREGLDSPVIGDALFHPPLLALTILTCAHAAKNDDILVSEISTWTGAVLVQTFSGLRESHRKLEWSLVLRKRCTDALVFLETMNLVSVKSPELKIEITDSGKKFLREHLNAESSMGLLLRGLRRAVIGIETRGFGLL